MCRRTRTGSALAALLGAALVIATAAGAARAAGPLVSTTVDPRARSIAVPRDFLGLSLELPTFRHAAGDPFAGGNPVLAELLATFQAAGTAAPVLRLGGGTADEAWWNPGGAPRPPDLRIDLGPRFLLQAADVHRRTGARFVLTLNQAAGRTRVATDLARAALDALPRSALLALEVGNEPDLYKKRELGPRKARTGRWTVGRYLGEASRFVGRLRRLRPRPPLAGPAVCCTPSWDRGFPRYLARVGRRLRLATWHHYPLADCRGRVPIRRLLRPSTLSVGLARVRTLVRTARRHRLPLRLTETSAAACGAVRLNASQAGALWTLDWFFGLAAVRTAGVNVHLVGTSPFAFAVQQGGYRAVVSPMYYAMILFARATGGGGRLMIGPTIAARPQRSPARVWAVRGRDGSMRIVVVNRGERAGTAVVRVRGRRRPGTVEQLTSKGLRAGAAEVRLAGQSVGHLSPTGALEGTPVRTTLAPRRGRYRIPVPAAGAALLRVPAR